MYLLSGHLRCSICGRRLQGQTNRSRTLYRCRHRDQYALTEAHPRNVYVAEDAVMPGLNAWLADVFAPDRVAETAAAIAAHINGHDPTVDERRRLDAVVRKASGDLQGLLEVAKSGGDAKALAEAINDTQRRLDEALEAISVLDRQHRDALDVEEVEALIRQHGAALLNGLDPLELRQVFVEMGLVLTYDPETTTVTGEMHLGTSTRWGYVRVGGGT